MRWRQLATAALIVGLLTAVVLAGIRYEQEVKTEAQTPAQGGAPPQTVKNVWYVSGSKARVESTSLNPTLIILHRFDLGKMILINPEEAFVNVVPLPAPGGEPQPRVRVKVTKTDETNKVGNYNCRRYDMTFQGRPGMPAEGVTHHYWMTTDLDLGDEYEEFQKAQTRLQDPKLAKEFGKLEGFPILTEMTGPTGETTITVSKVQKQEIPDSMFEIPASVMNRNVRDLMWRMNTLCRLRLGEIDAVIKDLETRLDGNITCVALTPQKGETDYHYRALKGVKTYRELHPSTSVRAPQVAEALKGIPKVEALKCDGPLRRLMERAPSEEGQ